MIDKKLYGYYLDEHTHKDFDIDNHSYDEIIGRFDAAVAKSMKEKCGDHNRIDLNQIWFSEGLALTVGMAVKQIAEYLGIPDSDISKNLMVPSVYQVDNDLIFLFRIPLIDAENIVVIPENYWGFKEGDSNKPEMRTADNKVIQ